MFLYSLQIVNIKVKVKRNQTGKVFVTSLMRLVDDDYNAISPEELEDGGSVYWEDEDIAAYLVTFVFNQLLNF